MLISQLTEAAKRFCAVCDSIVSWSYFHCEDLHAWCMKADNAMQAPIVSLDMYLDDESVVGEDLVAWLSMGIIHVPRGEVRALCFVFEVCRLHMHARLLIGDV